MGSPRPSSEHWLTRAVYLNENRGNILTRNCKTCGNHILRWWLCFSAFNRRRCLPHAWLRCQVWRCNRHWSYLRSLLNFCRSLTIRGPLAAKTRVQHAVVGQFRATFRVSTCLHRVRCHLSRPDCSRGSHGRFRATIGSVTLRQGAHSDERGTQRRTRHGKAVV